MFLKSLLNTKAILTSGILWCMLYASFPAEAREYDFRITGGTAFLHGDNTTSDAGPSLGLTFETIFNNVLSAGLEGTYQRLRGKSLIQDSRSIFYGSHRYDTKFAMLGLFTRLKFPAGNIQPYITLGTGAALWAPGENQNTLSLPMKKKISWSTTPLASLGSGIALKFGSNWEIDAGVKGIYFFSDELDNVDGRYVTGKPSNNEYTLQTGVTLVYRFGGISHSKKIIPEIIPEPKSIPIKIIPGKIVSKSDSTGDIKKLELLPESEISVSDSATADIEKKVAPNTVIRDIPAPEPVLSQPVINVKAVVPKPLPVKTQQPVRLTFLVHTDSFPTKDEADSKADILSGAGYRTQVTIVDRREIGKWFRVFVGPFSTKEEAERIADRLIKAGLSDYSAVIEETK